MLEKKISDERLYVALDLPNVDEARVYFMIISFTI